MSKMIRTKEELKEYKTTECLPIKVNAQSKKGKVIDYILKKIIKKTD
ncbi:hypothetical protein [Paenibacillus auburnensis]|nr:hypothetical protein [Paenibacillus auburnensis]